MVFAGHQRLERFPMPTYSSRDFGNTVMMPQTSVPEKLIHRNVEKGTQEAFSREREHPVYVVDLPSRTISMTLGHLLPRGTTRMHRHTYETILYILEGEGRTFIEDKIVNWRAGDAVYVPVWAWHYHENLTDRKGRYVACENAPLLQNLGNVALREEK